MAERDCFICLCQNQRVESVRILDICRACFLSVCPSGIPRTLQYRLNRRYRAYRRCDICHYGKDPYYRHASQIPLCQMHIQSKIISKALRHHLNSIPPDETFSDSDADDTFINPTWQEPI
jgi:hypothetical protein